MRYTTEAGNTYDPNENILYSDWDQGFFSNCTTTLWSLAKLANAGIEPNEIKTEYGWRKYQDVEGTNAFARFFCSSQNNIKIPICQSLPHLCQHSDYSKVMNLFKPFVHKWFAPQEHIKKLEQEILNKYNINLNKTIGIYRRVTDKNSEIKLASLEQYINAAKDLLTQHSDHKLFVQTDDTQTVEIFKQTFENNCISIDELTTSSEPIGIHCQLKSNKEMHGNLMLAVVSILSKCDVVLNCSSNVALWIYLYRTYNGNEFQFSAEPDKLLTKNDFGI